MLQNSHNFLSLRQKANERHVKQRRDGVRSEQEGGGKINVFPLILRRQRIQTEHHSIHNSSNNRIKSCSTDSFQQQGNVGSKILSRFVFKHLQKRINFQYNMQSKMAESPIIANQHSIFIKPTTLLQLRQPLEPIQHRNKTEGSLLFNNKISTKNKINLQGYSPNLKQKIGLAKRKRFFHRNIGRELNRNLDERGKKIGGSIDSYFDLSCLQHVQHSKCDEDENYY